MSYYMKTKKEMISNLQMINWYLDECGPKGHLKVIPMTWYEKWKPTTSYYVTAYSNPNRKGYMIIFNDKVLVDKLSPYMTYKAIGCLEGDIGNGTDFKDVADLKRHLERY